MAQWVIPVTVDVWVDADTLTKAKSEIRLNPPSVDIIGSTASYISASLVTFGEAEVVTKRPHWANQR